ncbi:Bcr/CflA family efflux MFS transporter [Azoarcus communis]|uniref:Bcr/CflA family efflux transporter n=1 Tax=Parazoarcus communis SWub3 = DSM 12120 TaxID=1121029 RepID=A0A323UU06_9RHOO|nr:multidrug effflux MFS transporter [Parazoarcus communis]NMG48097.1 Bcr/CflA family efflux MFS transporter [Parazoarcus communis]NMG71591.1 Bcr/CflA family efflux MFS transporter [Parazoarcus communis SWub3 = DSM 12120]PZA16502.1 Bcr/CflA family drug resistance efflux transporter [Azoarcus communis] [Parazoarcus communis SWub3 = DSM 12120]
MSSPLVVLFLSLLLGVQPITTDLYLPALPAITEGFGASMAQAQLTLSGLLLAFGISQLVWGPISDRFGRRPVLLVGLGAYVLSAIGSAFASSMELLILWRIVQGTAMGAAVMCARALVRDLYAPEAGARAMSKGLSGLGVIACLSTPLGGLVSDLFGWRMALLLLALFGAVTLGLVVMRFEETVRQPNPRALAPAILLRTWGGILRHPTFWAFALLATMTYGGLFTFLAASSFVFIKLMGLSKTVYGALMFSMSGAYLIGTVLCRRLLKRYGVHRTVAIGGAFSLVGGTVLGVLALAGVFSVWAIMVPVYLFMLGHGIHQPCGQSGAVGPFPQAAGAASALSGFLMMLSAFGMGHWLGISMDGSVFPLTNGIWFWGVMTAAVAWGLVWRVRPSQTAS